MKRVGTRVQVMHGNAKQTGGGLKKKDLKYNKHGKIVSKKASAIATKKMKGGGTGIQKYEMKGGGDYYPVKYGIYLNDNLDRTINLCPIPPPGFRRLSLSEYQTIRADILKIIYDDDGITKKTTWQSLGEDTSFLTSKYEVIKINRSNSNELSYINSESDKKEILKYLLSKNPITQARSSSSDDIIDHPINIYDKTYKDNIANKLGLTTTHRRTYRSITEENKKIMTVIMHYYIFVKYNQIFKIPDENTSIQVPTSPAQVSLKTTNVSKYSIGQFVLNMGPSGTTGHIESIVADAGNSGPGMITIDTSPVNIIEAQLIQARKEENTRARNEANTRAQAKDYIISLKENNNKEYSLLHNESKQIELFKSLNYKKNFDEIVYPYKLLFDSKKISIENQYLVYWTIIDFYTQGKLQPITEFKNIYKINLSAKYGNSVAQECNISSIKTSNIAEMVKYFGISKRNELINRKSSIQSSINKIENNNYKKELSKKLNRLTSDNIIQNIPVYKDEYVLRYSNSHYGIYLTGVRQPDNRLYDYISCHKNRHKKNTYITLEQTVNEQSALKYIKNKNNKFNFHEIYIKDYTAPTIIQLHELWNILKEKDYTNSVIIHCTAGYGRTGTMIMSYIWFKKALDIVDYRKTFKKKKFDIFVNKSLVTMIDKINKNKLLKINSDDINSGEKNYVDLLYYLMFQLIQYSYESYKEIFLEEFRYDLLKKRFININDAIHRYVILE